LSKQNVNIITVVLIQLYKAAECYFEGDYVSSITLAGACEAILAPIALERKGRNTREDHKVWDDQITSYFKLPQRSKDAILRIAFKARNDVKHNDTGKNVEIEYDFKSEAEDLMIDAINNYHIIFEQMPDAQLLVEFWELVS
jgi:hypothetical protein